MHVLNETRPPTNSAIHSATTTFFLTSGMVDEARCAAKRYKCLCCPSHMNTSPGMASYIQFEAATTQDGTLCWHRPYSVGDKMLQTQQPRFAPGLCLALSICLSCTLQTKHRDFSTFFDMISLPNKREAWTHKRTPSPRSHCMRASPFRYPRPPPSTSLDGSDHKIQLTAFCACVCDGMRPPCAPGPDSLPGNWR